MKWDRFRPVAYYLSERGLEFPLEQSISSLNDSREDQISIWELLQKLEGKSYQIDDQLTRLVVTTDTDTRTLSASTGILTITSLLLETWQEGIKPLSLTWFWLETSEFEAGTSHTFFVVDRAGDRIVCDEMSIVEGPETDSRFDRAVFEPDSDSRTSGLAAYWYGRFYAETKRGKLSTLASSWRKPKIFYGRSRSDLRDIRLLLVSILLCLLILLIRR